MLYLVSTPIGNLADITVRAKERLSKLDILLCEDTRKTQKLFLGLKIKRGPRLVSFYDENEEQKISKVIDWLKQGKEVGLVTNAGTPLISDPGWRLVKRCRDLNLPVTALPGACAAINALVLSGLPAARFCFLGFLPKKTGARKKVLESYKKMPGAKVVYESPFRVERLMSEIKEVYGDGVEIRICREMTKKYEEVLKEFKKAKGETTVVFI